MRSYPYLQKNHIVPLKSRSVQESEHFHQRKIDVLARAVHVESFSQDIYIVEARGQSSHLLVEFEIGLLIDDVNIDIVWDVVLRQLHF